MPKKQEKRGEIDKEAVISLTKKFVKINTSNPPGNEWRLAELIAGLLRQIGFKVELVEFASGRPNVVASLGSGKKTLILSGHMDTVPVGSGWKYDPFSGTVKDGKIFGRGATDMKGALVSMIEAVASLRREGWKPNGCLKLIFTVNEEMGDNEEIGMRALLKKMKGNKDSLVIIGDTTNFDIVVTEKGILWLELVSYGKEAHASMPWTGVNALENLIKVLYHIQNLKIEGNNKLLGKSTIAVTMLNAGIKTNVIPEVARAHLDIRLIPEEKREAVIDMIREIINRLSEEDRNINVKVNELLYYPPVEPKFEGDVAQKLKEIIEGTLKRKVSIVGEHGATGAGYFIKAGFPTIVFGPGKPENCHIKDEYVEISDLLNAAKIYREFILSYLS